MDGEGAKTCNHERYCSLSMMIGQTSRVHTHTYNKKILII